jgi:hypothetical protein
MASIDDRNLNRSASRLVVAAKRLEVETDLSISDRLSGLPIKHMHDQVMVGMCSGIRLHRRSTSAVCPFSGVKRTSNAQIEFFRF